MPLKIILLLLLCFHISPAQSLITLDEETLEFIEDAEYQLYANHKEVFSGRVNNDAATTLPAIAFDSVSFSAPGYKSLRLTKDKLSKTVLLAKHFNTLEEVIIVSSKKESIILGEQNKFVNSRNTPISKEIVYGTLMQHTFDYGLTVDKVVFYVAKIKYKTAYKVNFYAFDRQPIQTGHQAGNVGELLYATDTLYLQPGHKDVVEVPLEKNAFIINEKPVFVTITLVANYDEAGREINVPFKDSSKIKFRQSKLANYYSKMGQAPSGELTKGFMNINAMINYDFANVFFSKPAKSSIVTPAVLLYTHKE